MTAPRDPVAAQDRVTWQASRCIRCGICVRISDREAARPGISFSGRGPGLSIQGALGIGIGSALGETAAECVSRCPTAALEMQK